MVGMYEPKIDVFSHVISPRYKDALYQILPADSPWRNKIESQSSLFDLDQRFKTMDKFGDLKQIISTTAPPIELFSSPECAYELTRTANDEMAEMVDKYPDRFIAAVGSIPMNNIDAALKEMERIVTELKFKGIQIYTSSGDEPIDLPEFFSIYERMQDYDLPIWLHPYRPGTQADYRSERRSRYRVFHIFGWPYETSVTMARLVFSGVLEKYPHLKIITHHCGGMIPFFASRIVQQQDYPDIRREAYPDLTKPPIEYFKMFYADTALSGGTPALICGSSFFSIDHILFGTDMPYGPGHGEYATEQSIQAIEKMDICQADKSKIFSSNARTILNCPLFNE